MQRAKRHVAARPKNHPIPGPVRPVPVSPQAARPSARPRSASKTLDLLEPAEGGSDWSRQSRLGKFDLYYRVAAFPIRLPPLRATAANRPAADTQLTLRVGGRCFVHAVTKKIDRAKRRPRRHASGAVRASGPSA